MPRSLVLDNECNKLAIRCSRSQKLLRTKSPLYPRLTVPRSILYIISTKHTSSTLTFTHAPTIETPITQHPYHSVIRIPVVNGDAAAESSESRRKKIIRRRTFHPSRPPKRRYPRRGHYHRRNLGPPGQSRKKSLLRGASPQLAHTSDSRGIERGIDANARNSAGSPRREKNRGLLVPWEHFNSADRPCSRTSLRL